MGKNWANAKQHPETELLLFENYSHSCSTLSSKNNKISFKKLAKEHVCPNSWDYASNHDENENEKMKMKNRSHRYDINRPKSRHGHK